jgi:hypothetical protein
MRKWPRWAKVLWYIAWGIGVAGIIFTALKPSDFAVGGTVRVYLGIYGFICGFLGFYHSFSPDLQPSEQVSNPRALLRGTGIALMAGAVFYLCLLIYLPRQLGWR